MRIRQCLDAHDAERWLNQLSQKRLVELRYNATQVRMCFEHFDPLNDLGELPLSHIGNASIGIPDMDFLQISDG